MVFEVIALRQEAPGDAPSAVEVLELVGVEGVAAQEVEAEEERAADESERRQPQGARDPVRGGHRGGV